MFKNLLCFVVLISIILINFTSANSEDKNILPIKKPNLTVEEIEQKLSINILRPLEKPKKNNETEIEEFNIEISEKKIAFIIPKKKPIVLGKTDSEKVEISKYFNKKDFAIAKKAISEMEKSQWTKALSTSSRAKDKSINNFIQWNYLLTNGNQASFFDYLTFIDKNNDYPRIGRIRYLAEQKLDTKEISPKKIINWFGNNEPLSGFGKMILGESNILIGNVELGKKQIKEGWKEADLSANQLKFFRSKFKKYLDEKDYINRAEYLAWNNKYWDLKRILPYLPKDYELLYNARQLLMSKSYGVDEAIKNVPDKFVNDAGLNYDRLKWRRKRGRIDGSVEILLNVKNTKDYLVRPDLWWEEREIISRSLIYDKKFELAYKISSNHGLTEGSEFAEAEWISGWIALSFLKDPLLAKDHFLNFYNNVSYPISTARGAYWLGKTFKTLKDKEQSNKWFEEATKYLTTYYGQLAFIELNPKGNFELEKDMEVDTKYKINFYDKELVKIIYLLDELDKDKYTKAYCK